MKRISINNREDWLKERMKYIGGSESAAVVGLSPFMTTTELWELKTGIRNPRDLSKNESVSLGTRMEPVLRDMYKALHPTYKVEHHPFDILVSEKHPFMSCTLDGDVIDDDGRKGVFETKFVTLRSNDQWKEWNGRIPNHYLCQCTHQIAVTEWEFTDFFVGLVDFFTGEITIRSYHMEASDMQNDIDWLVANCKEFWNRVQNVEIPTVRLSL